MICISVTEPIQAEAHRQVERIVTLADVIELRMDLIRDGSLRSLMAQCRKTSLPVKILVTNRRKNFVSDGDSDEQERLAVLKEAVALGADYVDVEVDTPVHLREELLSLIETYGKKTELIVSYHDYQKTPSLESLKKIFNRCVQSGSGIIKIVTFARRTEDNLRILGLIPFARGRKRDIIAFCMGGEGRMSRMMAPLLGSYMSFASLSRDTESAPGQLTVAEMKAFMKLLSGTGSGETFLPISPATSMFALFGNPVAQSLSPLMHNAAMAAMNYDGRYMAFSVQDLASAIAGVRAMGIRGVSVTIPWKTAVMAHLDEVDTDALKIGAVNTIVNDNGRLKGYNTDCQGLVQSLEEVMEISRKTFAIIGAGGTARAAVFGILKGGGTPVILARNVERGEELAREWGCSFYPLNDIGKVKADCLINTTSVGMMPDVDESPVNGAMLSGFECVMDVIYNPYKTKLLKDAEEKGCVALSGLHMFVHQGAEQIKLWTGLEPPRALMRRVVEEHLIHGS